MTSNRHPTYHSMWETHLDPTLVRRLHRPLKQPGITRHQMANGLIERSQRLLKRLPLLEQQMHRWSSIVDLESEQAPIVYTHLQAQENNAEAPIANVSSAYALDLAQSQLLPLATMQLSPEQTQSGTVERSRSNPFTATPAKALVKPTSNDDVATDSPALNVVQMSKSTLAAPQSIPTQSIPTQSIPTQPISAQPTSTQSTSTRSTPTQSISTQSRLPFTIAPEVTAKPTIAVTSDKDTSGRSDIAVRSEPAVIESPQSLRLIQATRDRLLPSSDPLSVKDDIPIVSEPSAATTATPSISPMSHAVIQRKQDRASTAPAMPLPQPLNTLGVDSTDAVESMPFLETQDLSNTPAPIALAGIAQLVPTVITETAPIPSLTPLPMVQTTLNALPSTDGLNLKDELPIVGTPSAEITATPSISPMPNVVIQRKQDNANAATGMPLPQALNTPGVATDVVKAMPIVETQGLSQTPATIAPAGIAQLVPTVITETAAIPSLSPLSVVQTTLNALPSTEGLNFSDDISSVADAPTSTTAAPSISPMPNVVIRRKQDNASVAPAMPLLPFLETQGASTTPAPIASAATTQPDSIVINETTAIAALSPLPMVQTALNALPSTKVLSVKDKLPVVAGRSPTHDSTSTLAKTLVIQSPHNAALDASKPSAIAPNSPEAMPLLKNLRINESLMAERAIEKPPSSLPDAQSERLPTVHVALELATPQFEPLILSRPDLVKSKVRSLDSNLRSPKSSASKVDAIATANHRNASSSQHQTFATSNVSSNSSIHSSASLPTSLNNSSRNKVDAGSQSAAAIAPPPIDLDALADQVERQLMRRLVVESERRGKKKWH